MKQKVFNCSYPVDADSNWVQTLSVPVHLGLKMGPLCPIIWCPVMVAVFLY